MQAATSDNGNKTQNEKENVEKTTDPYEMTEAQRSEHNGITATDNLVLPASAYVAVLLGALKAEAQREREAKTEPSCFLFGADLERLSNGNIDGSGKVVIALGIADAVAKLHEWNYMRLEDSLLVQEAENDWNALEACLRGDKRAIAKAVEQLKKDLQQSEIGLREWKLLDGPKPTRGD